MNLKLKHEDLVPNYNAIITLIFIFYYRLHCFSVPTAPEQRKTTSSSLARERGWGGEVLSSSQFLLSLLLLLLSLLLLYFIVSCIDR